MSPNDFCLNSRSFLLVRWVGWGVGWVARLFDIINNSAQAEVGARAELGNKDFSMYIYSISVKYSYKIAT